MRTTSLFLFGATALGSVAATNVALAQDAQPTTTPPATTTTTTQTAAPEPMRTPDPDPEEKGRFRWGISALGGPLFTGGGSGGVGGVDVRLGAQINRMIGVYAQPVALIGAGASSGVAGSSASALVAGGIGVLGDFTFGDIFYVAAGPELMSATGGGSSVSVGGVNQSTSAYAGTFFSVAARTGLVLGSMKPERRKAFQIGLDFRMIFTSGDPTIVPLLALGYEAF